MSNKGHMRPGGNASHILTLQNSTEWLWPRVGFEETKGKFSAVVGNGIVGFYSTDRPRPLPFIKTRRDCMNGGSDHCEAYTINSAVSSWTELDSNLGLLSVDSQILLSLYTFNQFNVTSS